MSEYREKTLHKIDCESHELRIMSGFKVTLAQARDRVCDRQGWVDYAHCLRDKAFRGAD